MATWSVPRRAERFLFVAHGVVTLAATVVLAVWPEAIPATVGIRMEPADHLLSYFLAAAELAIGMLSIGAARLADPRAIRLIAASFAVFHLATAVLEAVHLTWVEVTAVLVANLVVRVVVGALFALMWLVPDRRVERYIAAHGLTED